MIKDGYARERGRAVSLGGVAVAAAMVIKVIDRRPLGAIKGIR